MNLMHNITTIDNEPRILDTDLAEALGFNRPTNIRTDVISPNHIELETFGDLYSRRLQTGGRPAKAYYLNRDQAILVCILSRTTRAKKIRQEVIRVFAAWQDGKLQPVNPEPQLPDFTNPAEARMANASKTRRHDQYKLLYSLINPRLPGTFP